MGRKIRAAKASLVAAFVAAGGAAAATTHARPTAAPIQATTIKWGDPLVRFLKLDGFPAYLKIDGFAQYYKLLSTPDALQELSRFYEKWRPQVDDVLSLYHKANGGPLQGILIGLEQYFKYDNIQPLLSYIKGEDAAQAYFKFETFLGYLKRDAPNAFQFFVKETSIAGDPFQKDGTDGAAIG